MVAVYRRVRIARVTAALSELLTSPSANFSLRMKIPEKEKLDCFGLSACLGAEFLPVGRHSDGHGSGALRFDCKKHKPKSNNRWVPPIDSTTIITRPGRTSARQASLSAVMNTD